MIFNKALQNIRAQQPDLNITSMVDMMAVLTIYLLASFATTEPGVRPLSDISLPASDTLKAVPVTALKVSVSPTTMRLDNELVTTLRAGVLSSDELDGHDLIVPLLRALVRERERTATLVQLQGTLESPQRDIIAIEAARGLPYSAVDRVVRTASAAGFSQFRLSINRKE